MTQSLDAALLEAHAAGDLGALVTLYSQAAETAASDEAAGFYLTHAYVFALDAGDGRAGALFDRLRAMQRI